MAFGLHGGLLELGIRGFGLLGVCALGTWPCEVQRAAELGLKVLGWGLPRLRASSDHGTCKISVAVADHRLFLGGIAWPRIQKGRRLA